MAAPIAVSPDVLITIKLQVSNENRRFKLPLKELGASTLPDKLRFLLAIDPSKTVIFERYSDSAGSFITLDSNNPSVYKQLYRAAKAKLKLRIKATILDAPVPQVETAQPEPVTPDRLTSQSYVPPTAEILMSADSAPNGASSFTAPPAPAPISSLRSIANPHIADAQRQAYATYLRHHFPTYALGANNSETTLRAPEADVEDEAPSSAQQVAEGEAPAPCATSGCQRIYTDLSKFGRYNDSVTAEEFQVPCAAFTVCCNKCHKTIPDAHWHCSICDDGDYDLCRDCVSSGHHCGIEGHFLIKRSVENGKVISSTTETLPKKAPKVETEKEVPGAFTDEVKEDPAPEMHQMSRTCNCCVNAFEESNFVTCLVCEDYDLCIPCHVSLKHGHHPNHAFTPVAQAATLDALATQLCAPGRNMRHMAICDGCDKTIYGVRHKCMNCPDWDYCSTCVKSARHIHPGHRFVPIYETISNPFHATQLHTGIHCDGPLCRDVVSYIRGDRYKCAVCHDLDFCANCEALPTNRHNRTHPLIKFRTPVRNVSVTTFGEKENGETVLTMGDKLPQTMSKATETAPAAQSANAATQVQTIAEVKPVEPVKKEIEEEKVIPVAALQAHFVRDTIPDGSKIPAGCQIQQVWVLRNPGPDAWPAGCSVRYTGGDNMMLNLDSTHPSSVSEIGNATESNVMERPVEVGEEVCFFVTIKAPQRPGKAISYWRLKAADGTPFGHKLWCDIDVVEPQPSTTEIFHAEHIENADREADLPSSEHIEHAEEEVKKEEADVKLEDVKEEPKEDAQHSQMIFPKLEKESPVSSTHEAQSQDQHSVAPESVSTVEQQLLDDVESLELDDESTSDDGFMTDEEYEILDFEDEEAINGRQ